MSLAPLGTLLDASPRIDMEVADTLPNPSFPWNTSMDLDGLLQGLEGPFLENGGQLADPDVLYFARGHPLSIALARDGLVFNLVEASVTPTGPAEDLAMANHDPLEKSSRVAVITLTFEGCNDVTPVGTEPLVRKTNYLIGNDPDLWVQGALSFREVIYEDLYDGIDLVFYFRDGMLKYDFVVGVAADPGQIVLSYEGVESLGVDGTSGDLLIHTELGTLRDRRPILLGSRGGEPTDAPSAFRLLGDRLLGDNEVGFDCREACARGVPFVIDPGLQWSTYIGGSGDYESIQSIVLDGEGNVYGVGFTESVDFPTTPGVHNVDFNGSLDGMVVKLDPSGSDLLVASYIGGKNGEVANDLWLASDGGIYVTGHTNSADFPVTNDAIVKDHIGKHDIFIVKLSSDASSVEYGTFLGGSEDESGMKALVQSDGTVYLFGHTTSNDLPTDPSAYCGTREGSRSDLDLFVMRLDSSLSHILKCTYIGGTGNDLVENLGRWPYGDLFVDVSGQVFVAGTTWSTDFPTTAGALRPEPGGGGGPEGFVSKLDSNLSTLLSSTYIGGSSDLDYTIAIVVGTNGSVYLTGETRSSDLRITEDALRTTFNPPYTDAYLMVFDNDLSSLAYGTFLGGSGWDYGSRIALGPDEECIYIWGGSNSFDIKVTAGAFDPVNRGGNGDCFLWEMDLASMNLTYTTYFGGSDFEGNYLCINPMVMDGHGMLHLCGYTLSTDLFTTEGAYNRTFQGGIYDGFILKLDPAPCDPPAPPTNFTITANETIWTMSWTDPPFNGARPLKIRFYLYNTSAPGNWSLDCELDWWENAHSAGVYRMGCPIGVHLRFRMSLVNSAGEGGLSNVAGDIWEVPPSAPLDLNATANLANGTINLTWLPPEESGTLGPLNYTIFRGSSATGLNMLAELGNVTEYMDTEVLTGELYYYAVRASNEVGEGPMSEPASVMPQCPPTAVRSLTAVSGDRRVELSWLAPTNDGGSMLLGYRIFRSTSSTDFTLLAELSGSTTSYLDVGLSNGEVYHYYVVVYTAIADGPPSEMITVSPFSVPDAPLALQVVGADGRVDLSWDPPDQDGGRPIEGYVLYFGQSPVGMTFTLELENVTAYSHLDLTNGATYYYQVAAVNEAGEGQKSTMASTMPMGLPGKPTGFKAVSGPEGVELTWSAPMDRGGAIKLGYIVLRGTSVDSLEPIAELEDLYRHLDTTGLGGNQYHYAVQASNPMGLGAMTDVLLVVLNVPPGPVLDLVAISGDGWIQLSWSPPESDGGASFTEYVLLRGTIEATLLNVGSMSLALEYNDTDVVNGIAYYYAVYAVNLIGKGERSAVANATPWARPNMPMAFKAKAKEDRVVLTWEAPISSGNAPVTGYLVLRGTSEVALSVIADLGPVLVYIDSDVEKDRTYYYQVVAKSEVGPSGPTTTIKATPGRESGSVMASSWPLIVLVIIVVMGAVAGYTLMARSRKPEDIEKDVGDEEEAIDVTTSEVVPAPPVLEAVEVPSYVIEEVFVVHIDGRPITSCAREAAAGKDRDLMSGMLIAIQGIIQDGLHQHGALESIKYGDNNILMVTGEHVHLAVVIFGEPDEALKDEMASTVQFIETTYAGVIEDWTGETVVLSGIDDIVRPLLDLTGRLTRKDVEGVHAARGVSILSAVDFHRGYVRLKVAAVNATPDTVVDASIELRYDADLLRLERVEPETLRLKGDRVRLGNVKPEERKTVAFLFDPQMCQGTHIDGTLTYYDSKGEFQRLDMKRRHADVVCPVFLTRENANTAMLRRLIKEKLHQSDFRVFIYPRTLGPEEALKVGKLALGTGDFQMVREYMVGGPPFEAEVWYYGETKVNRLQMVMRIGVVQQRRALEFFVASTAMEPVTGLIAEFRRDLERVVREEYPESIVMEPSRDEDVREELRGRALLLDRMADDGPESRDD
jgi:fibronectin type 3 domain-containing protein